MALYNKYIRVNFAKVIFILLIIITGTLFWIYTKPNSPKVEALIGGLATGFALTVIQFLLSWYEYAKIDKYQKLRIIDIRPDRDKRELYESLIRESKTEIMVLGVTANRLMNDFADNSSNNESSKVLLTALTRGVDVKILLPDKEHLEEKHKIHFDTIKARFDEVQRQFPNFQFKYFNHSPRHSIFLADDECILGPVFPEVSSKNTPSVHVGKISPFAKTYLDYFNSEWN